LIRRSSGGGYLFEGNNRVTNGGELVSIFYWPFWALHIVVLWTLGLFWGPIHVDSKKGFHAILITVVVGVVIAIGGVVALMCWIL
jgi:hypothetical protein